VQRRYGEASNAEATPQAGGFTLPDGANPGEGQLPVGGTAAETPGAESQGSQSSGSSTVIGTVLSLKGDTLTVQDFGGTTHTITLGSDVRVVLETTGDSRDVKRGTKVQVSGQTDDQGQVTATTITVR